MRDTVGHGTPNTPLAPPGISNPILISTDMAGTQFEDLASKLSQQMEILKAADKADPSGKTGKKLADAFLDALENGPKDTAVPANTEADDSNLETELRRPDFNLRRGPGGAILGGDGSRDAPFIVAPMDQLQSAAVQNIIVQEVVGISRAKYGTSDKWRPPDYKRLYYALPRGPQGNGDLCEHRFTYITVYSIWFDLLEVSRRMEEPGVAKKMFETVTGAMNSEKTGDPTASPQLPEPDRFSVNVCWFTGLPASPKHTLRKKLYLHLKKPGLFSREKVWKETIIEIPRSKEVFGIHIRQRLVLFVALIGMPLAAILYNWEHSYFSWWLRGLVGFGLGYLLYKVFYPLDKPGWRNHDAWDKYPPAAELLRKGWSDRSP